MEERLSDVRIFSIMEDEELQEVLNKINKNEQFTNEEVCDLLRQILHWRCEFRHTHKNFQRAVESRNKLRDMLSGKN